jgi:hypothetical protein
MQRPKGLFVLILLAVVLTASFIPAREFLTDKEIEKIQDAQEIDLRIKIYLEAAELRLRVAEERLTGKEPVEGEPLEFYTPEDMLEGYFRIIKSVMMNLDEVAEKEGPNKALLGKTLKMLKSSTEKNSGQLQVLRKIAEEKRKEELWNRVNSAIDITNGAHEGAEYGLTKHPAPAEKEKKKK